MLLQWMKDHPDVVLYCVCGGNDEYAKFRMSKGHYNLSMDIKMEELLNEITILDFLNLAHERLEQMIAERENKNGQINK